MIDTSSAPKVTAHPPTPKVETPKESGFGTTAIIVCAVSAIAVAGILYFKNK